MNTLPDRNRWRALNDTLTQFRVTDDLNIQFSTSMETLSAKNLNVIGFAVSAVLKLRDRTTATDQMLDDVLKGME